MSDGKHGAPVLALLAAFAAAGAQAAPEFDEGAFERRQQQQVQLQQEARSALSLQLRAVEVELYCDHPRQALNLMREARGQLTAELAPGEARHEMEQAIWHVRHGETREAIALLEQTRERLQQG